MKETRVDTQTALLQATGLHVLLFVLMFAGLQWTRSNMAEPAAGDPIGSLWYTVVCFVIAGLSLAAAWSTGSRRERMPENQDRTVTSPRV